MAKDCKKGCDLQGDRPHTKGGIPAIVTDTDKEINVESGEVVITKGAVSSDAKHTFDGKQMTNKEILSEVNQEGGGVPIMKDGGSVMEKGGGVSDSTRHIIRFELVRDDSYTIFKIYIGKTNNDKKESATFSEQLSSKFTKNPIIRKFDNFGWIRFGGHKIINGKKYLVVSRVEVHEEYQHKGYATKLYKYAIEKAQEDGFAGLYSETVTNDYIYAIAKKLGARVEGKNIFWEQAEFEQGGKVGELQYEIHYDETRGLHKILAGANKYICPMYGYIRFKGTHDEGHKKYIQVESIETAEDYRKQGVATKLYAKAISEAQRLGFDGLYSDNVTNDYIYDIAKKMGARIVGKNIFWENSSFERGGGIEENINQKAFEIRNILTEKTGFKGNVYRTLYHGTDMDSFDKILLKGAIGTEYDSINFFTESEEEAINYAENKSKYRGKKPKVIIVNIPSQVVNEGQQSGAGGIEYEVLGILTIDKDSVDNSENDNLVQDIGIAKHTNENLVKSYGYLLEKDEFKKGGGVKRFCDEGTEIQTILFDKKEFTEAQAKAWAEKHGFKSDVDEKENTYRLRQVNPDEFTDFRTIDIKKGIKAVVGCPKSQYNTGGNINNLKNENMEKLKNEGNRIPVLVKTEYEKGKYHEGIQHWTDAMIKEGSQKNTDNTTSVFIRNAKPEEYENGGGVGSEDEIKKLEEELTKLNIQLGIAKDDYERQHFRQLIKFKNNELQDIKESLQYGKEKYNISFNGRLNNAIGKTYRIKESVIAESKDAAINKLYEKYEHITDISINGEKYTYEKGGSIDDEIAEVEENIMTFEETLSMDDDANADAKMSKNERQQITDGIAEFRKQLAELKNKSESEKPEVKKAQKAKKQAVAEKIHEQKKVSYEVNESLKKQKIGRSHTLVKHSKDLYLLVHEEKKHSALEFERHKDGKWHVTCTTKEKKTFATLQQAVEYASKKIYSGELKTFMEEKKASLKARKERREKRKKAGKPVELTANEVAQKSERTVIQKIKDKKASGKSIKVDVNSAARKFIAGIKELKSFKENINPQVKKELHQVCKSF